MSQKLKKIMKMKKEDREIGLKEYAQELGASLQGLYDGDRFRETEIVDRIISAERPQREHQMWVIALISAVALALSALAAWVAILKYR